MSDDDDRDVSASAEATLDDDAPEHETSALSEATLDDDAPGDAAELSEDHEPIPKTQNDPDLNQKTRRRRWPWVVALIVAALGGAGAWFYFGFWKVELTAVRHVPGQANIVIRADAAQVLLFKPMREHVWPALLENRNQGADPNRRIARIKEETGVSLPTDLRELIVASVDGVAWVALIGGRLEPGRFVPGLSRVLQEEGIESWTLEDSRLLHTSGVIIAQADDGTLVIGTHREIVDAAMPATEPDANQPPVPTDGAIGFRLSHLAFKSALRAIPDSVPAASLHTIDEISGSAHLTDAPHLTLQLVPKSGTTPQQLASELSGMFSKLGLVLLLVPHDLYGAKRAISDAQVSASETTTVVVAPWPYAPLEQAVELLAKSISGAKSTSP